jgi:TP901 family phage tail tape measure protein
MASRSLTVNIRATGSSASITAIATAFRRAGVAKDAFAANVASKMPMIRRQLNATARAAQNLANLMPNGGNVPNLLPRRRGFGGGGLGLGGGIGAGIGIYGVGTALKKTSDDAATFENRMQQIRGVLELVGPAGEKQFNQLTYAAMRLSKESLGFGPLKVAETFQELAEKGWTLNQVISTTPRIMDLASVANMDLAKTSEIVAGTLNAYQLDVSKAGEVTDILQSSANKSSANLEYLGEALHHTSGFANLMGMNLQETVALLGGMSQSSVKASEAGYAMSTMFQRLINPTTRGTAALKEIDSIFKVTGKKRDEFFVGNTLKKGKMMDFLEVVQDFKNKVGDEHFGSTFSRIVGAKGGKLMQGFAYRDPKTGKSGMSEVVRMRKEIEGDVRGPGKKGIVEKQREVVENNFLNTTKKLVAALERMRISLGATINTELVQFITGLTSVVNWITEINDKYDGLIGKLALSAAAMTAFVVAGALVTGIVAILGAISPILIAVGVTLGALTYAWLAHKDQWIIAIEEIILKYRELISTMIQAAKWVADKAGGNDIIDRSAARAEQQVTKQKQNVQLAKNHAKENAEARRKKYDEERSAIKGAGGVPPGTNAENHSEPWGDVADSKGRGGKGAKDNLDIVGIEELHNKIQKNLFGGDDKRYEKETAENTKRMLERMEGRGSSGIAGGQKAVGSLAGNFGDGAVRQASVAAAAVASSAKRMTPEEQERARDVRKYARGRTENFAPEGRHGFGPGQMTPFGHGLSLPGANQVQKRGKYLKDANSALTDQTGGFGLGENLAAARNVRTKMGFPENTPLAYIKNRYPKEVAKELQENRDKHLLSGDMPSLEFRNQSGKESHSRGDTTAAFSPGKRTSNNMSPGQRRMAALTSAIASKEKERQLALGNVAAIRSGALDASADSTTDYMIPSPQQAFGVKSSFVASPITSNQQRIRDRIAAIKKEADEKRATRTVGGMPDVGGEAGAVKASVQNREAAKDMAKVEELLKTGNEKSDKFIEAISNLQLGYV